MIRETTLKKSLRAKTVYVKKIASALSCNRGSHQPLASLKRQPQVWEVSFREKIQKIVKKFRNGLTIPKAIILCEKKLWA